MSILGDIPLIPMIDIGINLSNKRFAKDVGAILRRAAANGVRKLIVTGTSLKASKEAQKLCRQWMERQKDVQLFFTAGVHPHDAKHFEESTLTQLRALAEDERCVAVGECGLDFNRMFSPQDVQERVFDAHLSLAKEVGKPLFCHERDAHQRFVDILRPHLDDLSVNICVHCFTGSLAEATDFLALSPLLFFGFTGFVTDTRRAAHLLDDVVHNVPIDRFMVETDGPFLLPRNLPKTEQKRSNRRCEPMHCPYVLKAVYDSFKAHAKTDLDYEAFGNVVFNTTNTFFKLPVAEAGDGEAEKEKE